MVQELPASALTEHMGGTSTEAKKDEQDGADAGGGQERAQDSREGLA